MSFGSDLARSLISVLLFGRVAALCPFLVIVKTVRSIGGWMDRRRVTVTLEWISIDPTATDVY
jgi:hypothetical protein